MLAAVAAWRQHPTEIEADLSDRGRRISDWHRGTMTSRELLVLLRHAPANGPYMTALRGGRQSRAERVAEETYNELARLRASYYSVNGGEEAGYEPYLMVDPVDEIEMAELNAKEDQAAEEDAEDFYTDLGFT